MLCFLSLLVESKTGTTCRVLTYDVFSVLKAFKTLSLQYTDNDQLKFRLCLIITPFY